MLCMHEGARRRWCTGERWNELSKTEDNVEGWKREEKRECVFAVYIVVLNASPHTHNTVCLSVCLCVGVCVFILYENIQFNSICYVPLPLF